MALNGPENCHIERNPMNIYCNGTENSINHGLGPYPHEKVTEMKRSYRRKFKYFLTGKVESTYK